MNQLKLLFLFVFINSCLSAQSYERFVQLYKQEKNLEKKAYYGLIVTLDKQEEDSKTYDLFIDKIAKKSKKVRILKKARTISRAVVSNFELPSLTEIRYVRNEVQKMGYSDFADNLSICEAYALASSKEITNASILYDRLYGKIKKIYLSRKNEFLPIQNYNLLTLSIAFHYFSVGETDQAIEYINDLIRYTDIKKRPNDYAMILNNAGTAFLSSKKNKTALEYYQKARVILKKNGNISEYDWNLFCMGLASLRLGKTNEALNLINEIQDTLTQDGIDYLYVEWELVEMIRAEITLKNKNYPESEKILNRILEKNREYLLNSLNWGKLYSLSYLLYKETGDYKKALYFHEKWTKNQEEFNRNKNKDNIALQLKFLALEKSRIKDKFEEKALKREEQLHKDNEIKIFSLFGIIILIIFIFLLRTVRIAKRLKLLYKKNNLYTKKIAVTLSEKEVMLKEIHHRVKNNFQIISSLLNIQAESIDEKKYSDPLIEAKNRIHSMSLIHQKMYSVNSNYVSIDFKTYLEDLLDSLHSSLGGNHVKLKTEIHIEKLDITLEKAVPIGLFCNEVFTNSYKHATNDQNELKLEVSLKKLENTIILRIKDSGPGFQASNKSTKSIGQQLKIILSQQLEGKLIEYNENGAVVELHFSR